MHYAATLYRCTHVTIWGLMLSRQAVYNVSGQNPAQTSPVNLADEDLKPIPTYCWAR